MTSTEMREAVALLPDEYLTNYTESFEAGIVGPFHDGRYCVLGCFANAVGAEEETRTRGYLTLFDKGLCPKEPAIDRLHRGYCRDNTPAFRTALYDACVAETAHRASASLPVRRPAPATVGSGA